MMAVTAPFTSVISNSLSMSVGGLLRGRECVSSCFCIRSNGENKITQGERVSLILFLYLKQLGKQNYTGYMGEGATLFFSFRKKSVELLLIAITFGWSQLEFITKHKTVLQTSGIVTRVKFSYFRSVSATGTLIIIQLLPSYARRSSRLVRRPSEYSVHWSEVQLSSVPLIQ